MRVAIIGGTFSPPHNGHIELAVAARDSLNAKVLIMPNSTPPHKFCEVSKQDRREMTRLAFERVDGVVLDDTELLTEGKSFTYETMEKLKCAYPYDELFFVIGGDSLRDFSTWRFPERILKNCRLAVAARQGIELEKIISKTEEKYKTKIKVINMTPCDISSTKIRVNVNFGFDNSKFLPIEVEHYIKQKGLYCDFKSMVDKLSLLQSRERFLHTYNVVLAGLEIAHKTDLNPKDVFVACLLHDCAKNIPKTMWGKYDFDNKENLFPPVVHCGLGVEVAKRDFDVTDENILNAIRYHTTCRPNMSQLDKLVFVADKVELTRSYPELESNYNLATRDLEKAFTTVLGQTYRLACSKHGKKNVDSMTRKAMEYYLRNEN